MNNNKSIYDCYEEIRQREISELKEKLKAFGGVAHFGPDYTGEGSTGSDFPFVLVNTDEGPFDMRVHAVSLSDDDHLEVLASYCDGDCQPRIIRLNDIMYGYIEFITEEIPVRTFNREQFNICVLSRADLESIGFDVSDVDDDTMDDIAIRLGEDYCEQLFWTSLEIIAEEGFNIPRKS